MDKTVEDTLKALNGRDFKGWFAETTEEAKDLILDIIPLKAVVGIGDSSTIRQIGVIEALKNRENIIINPFDITNVLEDQKSYFEFLFWPSLIATLCDVFVTGTNAITEDGKIVNIDGAGNRVSGIFWGHPKSIVVVGRNKIVKDVDAAIDRIKNLIAPEHIRRKGGSSPCTIKGKCHDCSGKERICAVTTIIEHKPLTTEINVIIVDKDLGLGWDSSWPKERIENIIRNNEKFVCRLPHSVAQKTDINQLWEIARKRVNWRWLLGRE